MDVSRRSRAGVKASVVAGSVWESRMKLDEVKGGIKVFTGEEQTPQEDSLDNTSITNISTKKMVKKGQVPTSTSGSNGGKRKTWKSQSFEGPIQVSKGKNVEEVCKELSVSDDGINKRSPIQVKKSLDGIVKSPIQMKKRRSEGEGNEKSPIPIQGRKLRSDSVKEVDESGGVIRKVKSDAELVKVTTCRSSQGLDEVESGIEKDNSVMLRKVMSEPEKVLDLEEEEPLVGTKEEEIVPEVEGIGSEESCKEFGVCHDKVVSSSQTCGGTVKVKSPPQLMVDDQEDQDEDDVLGGDDELEGEEEDEEDEEVDEEIEIEIEKKSLDIKEINIPEENSKEVETKEIGLVEEKSKKLEIKQPELKPKRVEFSVPEQKPKRVVVNEEKRVHQFGNRIAPTSPTVNRQPPPVIKRASIYQNIPKSTPTVPVTKGYQSFPETHGKLQNLVNLVMWRDISRSAFVFGIGTFSIISSSYTKDLNVSSISVISYLGLVYLASIFLYRSIVCRGVVYVDEKSYVVGEQEAIWLLKLVLPYLNELLLKIRALFSGDPATTMKLAVLLFVFARCGSSITIWKLAKLGFFGVFTVPKVYSSYSNQLAAYAKFWIRRFRDAWDSCSHKKAVALAVFTLVWNLSSMVARVWAIFMMFVAVRYYQQAIEMSCEWEEDAGKTEETLQRNTERQGSGPNKIPTSVEVNNTNKAKKGS